MWPWLIAGLVLSGLYLYGRAADAAAATLPPVGPDVPAGPPNFMAVITNPATIKQNQAVLAAVIANKEPDGVGGLHIADYNAGDVDGNAHNPRWIAALSAVQRLANTEMAAHQAYIDQVDPQHLTPSDIPAGFPKQVRTDGVLDYATAIVMINA